MYRFLIILAVFTASCSSGGGLIEGGQSGTGVAAIVGNVATVGGTGDISQIQVTVAGSTVTGVTDATGNFSLSGDVSGPEILLFERERDGLRAEVEVVIPAGGRIELGDIEIDVEEGRAIPAQQFIEFEGIVETLNCTGGELLVATRLEGVKASFVLFLADAFIHDRAGNPVPCTALFSGIELEVKANVNDLGQLSNADVEVEGERDDGEEEEGQGQPGQEDQEQPQDEGVQEDEPKQGGEEDDVGQEDQEDPAGDDQEDLTEDDQEDPAEEDDVGDDSESEDHLGSGDLAR